MKQKNQEKVSDYGCLYDHLCSAQDIAYKVCDENAGEIEKIRLKVGETLLSMQK